MSNAMKWAVAIILVILLGFLAYSRMNHEAVTVKSENSQANVSSANNSAEMIRFQCADNKMFRVAFAAASEGKASSVHIVLDNKKELTLPQSISSPHAFESSDGSFYVEGDEASLQMGDDKYDNCAAG